MSAFRRIAAGYTTSLFGVFSGLLSTIWLTKQVTAYVDLQEFGVYTYFIQLCAFLAFIQLGMDFASGRDIAECLGKGDFVSAKRVYNDLRRFNIVATAVTLLAVILILASLQDNVRILLPNSVQSEAKLAREVVLFTGAGQLILLQARPYTAWLIGSGNQHWVNIANVARSLLATCIGYYLLKNGFRLRSLMLAEIISQSVSLLAMAVAARSTREWRDPTIERLATGKSSNAIRFALVSSIGGAAWTVEAGADALILGMFLPPTWVATYILWWRAPQMIFDLCTRLSSASFPEFSRSFGISRSAARKMIDDILWLSSCLAGVSLIGVSAWLPSFVDLWVGIGYAENPSRTLPFLFACLIALRILGNFSATAWMASGDAGLTTRMSWAQAITKVSLSIVFVPVYGLVGLAVASCTSALMQVVVLLVCLIRAGLVSYGAVVAGASVFLLALMISFPLSALGDNRASSWSCLAVGAFATAATWLLATQALAVSGIMGSEAKNRVLRTLAIVKIGRAA